MTPRLVITGAAVAAIALPSAYLALGGGEHRPSGVADPCRARAWRNPSGAAQIAQQIASSALDGAACELGVSREELSLALVDSGSRDRFARAHHLDDGAIELAVRHGLARTVDDAEKAGGIGAAQAFVLRGVANNVPVDELLSLIRNGRGLLS